MMPKFCAFISTVCLSTRLRVEWNGTGVEWKLTGVPVGFVAGGGGAATGAALSRAGKGRGRVTN